jgi:hypothetical protein
VVGGYQSCVWQLANGVDAQAEPPDDQAAGLMKPCGALLQRETASVAQAQKAEARQNLQQAISE